MQPKYRIAVRKKQRDLLQISLGQIIDPGPVIRLYSIPWYQWINVYAARIYYCDQMDSGSVIKHQKARRDVFLGLFATFGFISFLAGGTLPVAR